MGPHEILAAILIFRFSPLRRGVPRGKSNAAQNLGETGIS